MSTLDVLIPTPRVLDCDHVDLAAPPEQVWALVRHGDLARSPWIRALFALRALPSRLAGHEAGPASIHIDDLVATPERPGFGVLGDDPPHEVTVGAIGKVWEPQIPFVHVAAAAAFAAFATPGYIKVAWSVRVSARGERDSRLELELRVDSTDETAWKKFRAYFLLIGPGSRFIRRVLLSSLARELGSPEAHQEERPLAGDDLVPDAQGQITSGITIQATPEQIWPWLLQMGWHRGGFYSLDLLDNGGEASARELHPDLGAIAVGDIIPASAGGDGFEVLRLVPARHLVLGGLYDVDHDRQRPFAGARPSRFWQVTWSFVLEPLDAHTTRLHVRARAAFPPAQRLHAAWIRPVHHVMETVQLHRLAARVEGRVGRDGWRDVLAGVGGAGMMAVATLTPFLRSARNHWGVSSKEAARPRAGDDLIVGPRWSWTHGVEIDAPAESVWPWVAQLGADRGGFYSYQWLENLAGCELRNAERIHPEWQLQAGDGLRLHPKMPPLCIVRFEPGRHLVAYGAPDERARAAGRPWAEASWLLAVEPITATRCRVISRYRAASSDDVASCLEFGPSLMEPIGFAMDRKMLLGIRERAEHASARLGRIQDLESRP